MIALPVVISRVFCLKVLTFSSLKNFQRSLKREPLIIKWMLRITHKDKDGSIDFADWIQDGQILSNVMTTLCFNSVERDRWSSFGCSPEEQRVKDVRAQILDYGVADKYLFRVEDVTKKYNTPKVVRCLEEVAKLVSLIYSLNCTLRAKSEKITFSNSLFGQNSQFRSLIFDKIHNFIVSFLTKFTIPKSHFSQNSHFQNLKFTKFTFSKY